MNLVEAEKLIKQVRDCDDWLLEHISNRQTGSPVKDVWLAAADGVIARRKSLLVRIKNETSIDVTV